MGYFGMENRRGRRKTGVATQTTPKADLNSSASPALHCLKTILSILLILSKTKQQRGGSRDWQRQNIVVIYCHERFEQHIAVNYG